MTPYQVRFHLYAENEDEIRELQCTLYDFVSTLYNEGVLLTAPKLKGLVDSFSKNPYLKYYLK